VDMAEAKGWSLSVGKKTFHISVNILLFEL